MFSKVITIVISLALMIPTMLPAAPDPDKKSYIVVLKKSNDVKNTADDVERNNNGRVRHMYRKVLRGFSIDLPERAMRRLRNDPRVAYIEPNITLSIVDTQPIPLGLQRIYADPPI